METQAYPVGTAEASGFGPPNAKAVFRRVEQQAVTPIGEGRTRYLYASGVEARDRHAEVRRGDLRGDQRLVRRGQADDRGASRRSGSRRRPIGRRPRSRRTTRQPCSVVCSRSAWQKRGAIREPLRQRLRPRTPRGHLRPARLPRAALRHRRGSAELRRRGHARQAGAAPDPGSDRVVVGLRGGAPAAGRALPGLRRRPARPGPLDAHARPLHARQHGQRPGALHRPGDPPAHARERPLVGRRAVGVALGVRAPRAGARRVLRGSAAVRLRAPHVVRPVDPPEHRRDVRALEQVPRRPVEHRRLGRAGRRGAARAARRASRGWPGSSPSTPRPEASRRRT